MVTKIVFLLAKKNKPLRSPEIISLLTIRDYYHTKLIPFAKIIKDNFVFYYFLCTFVRSKAKECFQKPVNMPFVR